MNITLNKHSNTEGTLNITLSDSDYLPKVDEKMKDYSRKASIKGFRPGKVPTGVIKKMFGKSILVEEVNHLISHSISDYVKNNKLKVVGDPLPNEEKARAIDWDNQKDFEFEFQLGLVEDFEVELSSTVVVSSHPIEVDQKVIDETLTQIKRRFGKVSYPETSEAHDNLFGEVSLKGSEEKKVCHISIETVEKPEQERFIGLKKEDTVEFDIEKTFADESERARALNLTGEEAKNAKGIYVFQLVSLTRVEPAEMDQDLFEKMFGKDAVKTEEEFLNKLKETITSNYRRKTEQLLDYDIQHYYEDNTKITMPDNFLKNWLKKTSGGQVTDEVLEKELTQYKESLKWDLIKNQITEEKSITIGGDEVREIAKKLIIEQLGGEAIAEQLGSKLDGIAINYLAGQDGKGENFRRICNQLLHDKIMKVVKEAITINEKKVSFDEFKKIAASRQH